MQMRFLLLNYVMKMMYRKASISSIKTPLNKRVGEENSDTFNGTVISAKEAIKDGY